MKPIVDGIESDFSETLAIIRLNIQEPAGQSLARQFGAHFTPTFIFFNSQGMEEWRSIGKLDAEQVRLSLSSNGS